MIQLEDVGAIITLATKHDPNGNPRRLTALFDRDGQLIAGAEHGYAGQWHAITTALGRDVDVWSDRLPWPIELTVGITEWRTWRARITERMALRAELVERYGIPNIERVNAQDASRSAAAR